MLHTGMLPFHLLSGPCTGLLQSCGRGSESPMLAGEDNGEVCECIPGRAGGVA